MAVEVCAVKYIVLRGMNQPFFAHVLIVQNTCMYVCMYVCMELNESQMQIII